MELHAIDGYILRNKIPISKMVTLIFVVLAVIMFSVKDNIKCLLFSVLAIFPTIHTTPILDRVYLFFALINCIFTIFNIKKQSK